MVSPSLQFVVYLFCLMAPGRLQELRDSLRQQRGGFPVRDDMSEVDAKRIGGMDRNLAPRKLVDGPVRVLSDFPQEPMGVVDLHNSVDLSLPWVSIHHEVHRVAVVIVTGLQLGVMLVHDVEPPEPPGAVAASPKRLALAELLVAHWKDVFGRRGLWDLHDKAMPGPA